MKKYLTLIIISCFLGFANLSFSQTQSNVDYLQIRPELENIHNDSIRAYDLSEVEEIPLYVGGYKEMSNFIIKNLNYPKSLEKTSVSGKVFIGFSVESDGKLSDFTVIKGIHPDLDNEALRVVKLMPKWNPGKVKGKAVKIKKIVIPFNFEIK
ncbi:MAG: hypothetical protein RLZZ175_1014 [Bacteroidota bacterium]|jgi:protein TonB